MDVHGEATKVATINMLKKICQSILAQPMNLKMRNLAIRSLQKKFHCGTPIQLLIEYGFMRSYDYTLVKSDRLRYDSSDLTPLRTMLRILDKFGDCDDKITELAKACGVVVIDSRGAMEELKAVMALKQLRDSLSGNGMQLQNNLYGIEDDDDEKYMNGNQTDQMQQLQTNLQVMQLLQTMK